MTDRNATDFAHASMNPSAVRRSARRLPPALMATASALVLTQIPAALPAIANPGQCTEVIGSGTTTVTCTGTIDGGAYIVVYNPGFSSGLIINSDATLSTTGANASGIVGGLYGAGGNTRITSSGPILTAGDDAIGISGVNYSQGNMTITSSGSVSTTGQNANGITGSTLNGGNVLIVSSGTISTDGQSAWGIYGSARGAGDIAITASGVIATTGYFSFGIKGDSPFGNTTITSNGAISTAGDRARGIVASTSATGNASITLNGNVTTTGFSAHGISGYSYGGGDTSINLTGSITTTGWVSSAIIGSSSGGNTIINSNGIISTTGAEATGIFGGTFGNRTTSITSSGTIITSSGTISTTGRGAYGIGGYSQNGSVTINASGVITTTGDQAFAILGRSDQGNTTINASGVITTTGYESGGIGVSTDGIGIVSITASGVIATTSNYAHAIQSISSHGNTIITVTDTGRITSISPYANAIDISSSQGQATLDNAGTITGNVSMIGAISQFNNRASGVFNSGESAYLSSIGTLTNAGTVSPGGTRTILTTSLSGNYVQTATGVLKVDADWTGNSGAGTADLLAISGTASLAGTVLVNPLNFPSTGGLTREFTVLTAYSGITNNGITIANTAAVNYALLYPDTNTLNVQATINFQGVGVTGLTANQSAVGGNLNAVLEGGTTLGFMPALMTLPNGGALGSALNQLAPIADGGSNTSAMVTGSTFAGQLLSCRVAGEGDEHAVIREGQCVWARASARRSDRDNAADSVGQRENATFVSAGAQFKLSNDWRIGGGLGYETTNLTTANTATSKGERLHVGGVVKYNPGAWLLAASVTGGHGWSDNTRHVAFGGFDAVAMSDSEMSFVAGRFTAAYLHQMGALYLKPQVELASTHLNRDGYTESGIGGIALSVREASATVWSFSPSLELGSEHRLASGGIARVFFKGGATWLDTDTFATSASFLGAPAGTSPFTVASKVDRVVADVGAGIDLITLSDTALRLQYDGQFGETTTQHGGSAKLGIRF
jgi:uncharacterized protein with beta-barrel porin domain